MTLDLAGEVEKLNDAFSQGLGILRFWHHRKVS
jgi:hypothetical protein